MIILIDLTPVSYHMTGIERYAVCIARKMIEIDKDNQYILLFRDEIYGSFNDLVDNRRVKSIILHGNNKAVFNIIQLPCELRKINADIYLFLAITSPILFSRKNGIVTTMHDMAVWDYPRAFSLMKRIYFKFHARVSLKGATKIITVSEFSKNRISKILKIDNDKIFVVPSAISETIKTSTDINVQHKYNLPQKYILSLSTIEPRKNLKLLVESFAEISPKVNYDLVLVGRKGWGVDELLSQLSNQERIHVTGYVDDEDIASLYKNAMCFVFPTAYEGFGLPPVEALAMGTPVISSDAASMPEVLRHQAVYFKSGNKEELQDRLLNLEDNIPLMPHELDEYQKEKYDFSSSAREIIRIVNDE